MNYRILHCFSLPKEGNTPEENEDAYAISKDQSLIVLSDGASEGMYSKEWAQHLCHNLCAHPTLKIDPPLLSRLGQEFQSSLDQKEVPWYVENKMRETGAAATLLWIRFHKKIIKSWWEVGAIGDSCAFIIQDSKLLWSWPLEKTEDFDTSPELVYNHSGRNGKLRVRTLPLPRGKSTLILATDALAALIIEGIPPDMENSHNDEQFNAWIRGLRNTGKVKNDDSTMIIIEAEN